MQSETRIVIESGMSATYQKKKSQNKDQGIEKKTLKCILDHFRPSRLIFASPLAWVA